MPGELGAGAARRFAIRFGEAGAEVDERSVTVATGERILTVTNGDIVLEHVKGTGGMIRNVTVGGSKAALTWNDKIFDGQVYYLANHSAERMEVKAGGPLRAVVEAEGEYLDDGKSAGSKPRGNYRFTTYAGLPFTLVEADVTQDFAHQWRSLHFIEMQIGDAGFTHYVTDKQSGALKQAGKFAEGSQWASVYNDKLLLAVCASQSPGVYDGGGRHYGAYLRGGVAPMSTTRYPWKGAILYGAGKKALEDKIVEHWSAVLADPPTVRITFDKLGLRVVRAVQAVREKENALESLSGTAWAPVYVAVTIARQHAEAAQEAYLSGSFRAAVASVEACKTALDADAVGADLEDGAVQVGMVAGHPYLSNDAAAYLWATPANGSGLISIYDRQERREFLKADPAQATLWDVAVKHKKGGTTYTNVGVPCDVRFEADDDEGRLVFRWSKGITVEVEVRLSASEPLLRARINAATKSDTAGLATVTFPVISDIKPLTANAQDDTVLETWGIGFEFPSPLASGKVSSTNYPNGMQFTALLGDGVGLYVAEEDGDANRKQLTWTPDADAQSLDFSISHPVLNWAADEPVGEYESPGEVVCGPFEGDWYDAARIYRKWALTAPWCAKGPITEREDYPQWLAKAPYWTIGYFGNESEIERQLETAAFYEIPIMVAHTYNYYIMQHQDDRYPDHWPPKLGSEGLTNAVREAQENGIRIVPYVNGWVWDQDTESFRTKDAENKAALWGPTGGLHTMTSYGGGQKLVGMCPASKLWRETMLGMVQELVGRYGVDGVYFDFLTIHTSDCYNKDHGHAICGGDYWTKAVHGLYEEVRALAKELNPEAMITGEDVAEYCIDVHDTFLCMGKTGTSAPLFLAVYHGYANVFGGDQNKLTPLFLGRWWLMGSQNGWRGPENAMIGKPPHEHYAPSGIYYKRLLRCRWQFATPYLGTGEMLRPPAVTGGLPTITDKDTYQTFTVQTVEGSAWKASDGTVGVFFLNYDDKNAHTFTWTTDLAEVAGIDGSKTIKISRWTPDKGLVTVKEATGGVVSQTMTAEPLDIIALKLEVVK